jgi:hypothetical protein
MMKRILIIILFLFLIAGTANAIEIKVNISEVLNVTAYSFSDLTNNIFKGTYELYNTGSLGYKARIRIDILKEEHTLFTGWSDEKALMAGEMKTFEVYWYTAELGNYSIRTRIYYGNEIRDLNETKIEIKNVIPAKDVFQIKNFRTYDKSIKFTLISNQSLSDVIIIPTNYPTSWIFEQKKINLEANRRKIVVLPYDGLFYSRPVTIMIFTEDGRYATTKTFQMEKEVGLMKYIHFLIDNLRDFLDIDF